MVVEAKPLDGKRFGVLAKTAKKLIGHTVFLSGLQAKESNIFLQAMLIQ